MAGGGTDFAHTFGLRTQIANTLRLESTIGQQPRSPQLRNGAMRKLKSRFNELAIAHADDAIGRSEVTLVVSDHNDCGLILTR